MKETVICVLMRGPKVMVQKEGTAMKLPQFEVDSVDEATVVGGLAKMGLQTKGNHIRMLAKFQQDKKHATHLCIGFCQNEHKEWEKVYPAKIVQSIEQLGDKQFEGTN